MENYRERERERTMLSQLIEKGYGEVRKKGLEKEREEEILIFGEGKWK